MTNVDGKEATIFINEEKCLGCNKCVRYCPVFGANISYTINGATKVKVNPERCIHCGLCVEICDHKARDYRDDTDRFFADLLQGKPISVMIAPSARTNFLEYKKVIGYLKSLGAHLVYDVSFGADITVWAYLKTLEESKIDSLIAQPCPVIVNYVEKYQPELIDHLAPVHSPMLCAAIYLRKYEQCQDHLAFLSPCIAKIDEIHDANTDHLVEYNITFAKFLAYLQGQGVDLSEYPEKEFDNPEGSLGYLFPRPGGLRENVEAKLQNVWVRQVEGQSQAYTYLRDYRQRVKDGKELPTIVDILNCQHGCNKGTGTSCRLQVDDIDLILNTLHQHVEKKGRTRKSASLLKKFNQRLQLNDFTRRYKNSPLEPLKEPTNKEYEEIFLRMHKTTDDSRKFNCSACGYNTCQEMAKAIYNNYDRLEDCIDYNRREVIKENKKLEEKNAEISSMLQEVTHLSQRRQEEALNLTKKVNEITSSMEEVYKGNEQAVKEVEMISQDVAYVVEMTEQLRTITTVIKDKVNIFTEATADIVGVARQTKMISLNAGIEAARSGEHGKGIGVLAQEIKKLADESRETAEVALTNEEELHELVLEVYNVSNLVDKKMEMVNKAIINISAIIEEFTAQGQEMVAAATQIVDDYRADQG